MLFDYAICKPSSVSIVVEAEIFEAANAIELEADEQPPQALSGRAACGLNLPELADDRYAATRARRKSAIRRA